MAELGRDTHAHRVAVDHLKTAADAYMAAFTTKKDALENMADDFCRFIAEEQYPSGWNGMVHFIMKAAG